MNAFAVNEHYEDSNNSPVNIARCFLQRELPNLKSNDNSCRTERVTYSTPAIFQNTPVISSFGNFFWQMLFWLS